MTASSAEEKVHSERKPKIFYGWWIVLSCAVINLYIGGTIFYGFTAFFNPLRDHFGWSSAALALPLALRSAEVGIAAPLMGLLVDKVGSRKLMFAGALVSGLGAIWLSRVNSLGMFYVVLMVTAIGSSACIIVPTVAVANWFDKKVGKAMGFMLVGMGASGILVPLIVWLIDWYGWQTTLVILGVGTWIVCLPLSLLIRDKPERYGYLPDGTFMNMLPDTEAPEKDTLETATEVGSGKIAFTAKEALRTRAFWLLTLATSIGMIAISAMLVHIIAYLESVDIPTGTAGLVVTFLTLLSIVGRLGFGWLGDIFDKSRLMAIALALEAIGVFIFAYARSVWLLIPFLLTFAPAFGALTALRLTIQREYFGRTAFGTIQGITLVVITAAMLLAPPIVGWVYDARGSYYLAWLALAIITATAIPLALAMKPPQKTRSAENHI